jgi:hypothetical protein
MELRHASTNPGTGIPPPRFTVSCSRFLNVCVMTLTDAWPELELAEEEEVEEGVVDGPPIVVVVAFLVYTKIFV